MCIYKVYTETFKLAYLFTNLDFQKKKKKNSTYNSLLNHFDKAGSQSVTGFKAKFNDLIEYIALGNTSLDDIIHSLSYHDNNGFCYSDCTLQRIRFRKIIELNVTTTTTEKSTELEWQP